MKKLKALLAIFLAISVSFSNAQTTKVGTATVPTGVLSSPNLIYSTVNPANLPAGTTAPYSWSGFTTTTSTGGGTSGGNQPGYNTTTGTFMFGYTQSTIAYTYAFSQALQNSGMSIVGYNYSFQYLNQGTSRGSLTASLNFASTNGQSLYSKNWTLGPTTDWTTLSGTETFTNSLLASNIANFSLSLSGKDDRFWAGYYGPQIKVPTLSLNYTFDQCSVNPLSSPSCSGYAAAYQTQQCSANPLYSTACPGYQAAYTTQQCSANPLYSTSCPGYAAAYQTQQCTNNPLYSTSCPGYQQAYHDQQCSINPLYASDCTGYQQAYHDQQCSINPLYATDCAGYQQAYLNAQCIKDSLYSRLCSGYNTAYAIKNLVPNVDSAAVNQSLSGTAAVAASNPTSVNTNGSVSTTPSTTGSTTVDSVISTPTTTSTTSATSVSPAATNSVITPQAPAGSPMSQAMSTPQNNGPQGGGQPQQQANNQPAPSNNRKEQPQSKDKQEEKQKEAVAANKGAKSMDEQKAAQNALIASMGSVPGFDVYSKVIIKDSLFYKPYDIYKNQKTIDNKRNLYGLFGPNDVRYNEIINSQYKLGN